MLEALLLFVAAFFGGMLNAVAGGGTFITFPALVFVGIPPVVANATSTIAALPGYLSAAIAFRGDIRRIQDAPFAKLTIWTMIGGAIGNVIDRLQHTEEFVAALAENPRVRIAYVVTDDERRFQTVVSQLPSGVEPVRLYESYLRNFEIDAARSAR